MHRLTQPLLNKTHLLANHPRLHAALPWLLALLAIAYTALHWSQPLALSPDSGGYLSFSDHRTAGYPLFLKAVDALFGTTDAAPKVQLVLAAAAFAFLGWSLHRAFRSPLFALLPVLALMLYPRVTELHAHILTESVFISLMCVMAGGITLSLHCSPWRWMVLAAVACGLAITVRPAAFSLLAIWPFLLWLAWRRYEGRRLALTAAVIAPIAICLLAETLVWHATHDSDSRPNLADRHLFAKALLIDPAPSLSDPDLAAIVSMGREVMAPGRALIAGAPNFYSRIALLAEFEVAAQHATYRQTFSPAVRAVAAQRGLEEHQLLAEIGRPAMLSEPVAWIGNALTHYLGMWSRGFVTLNSLNEFQSYIDSTEPNDLYERISFFRQGVPHGSGLGFAVRFTLGIILLVIPVSAVLSIWQRIRQPCPDSRLAIASIGALAVHSHLLFVGLFGVMAGRYADSMAPMMAASGVLLAAWLLDQLRRRPHHSCHSNPQPSQCHRSPQSSQCHSERSRGI